MDKSHELVEAWEKTGLLSGLEGDRKGRTAVALENQRLINLTIEDNNRNSQFKRVSIPIIRRLFGAVDLPISVIYENGDFINSGVKFPAIETRLGLDMEAKETSIKSAELASVLENILRENPKFQFFAIRLNAEDEILILHR